MEFAVIERKDLINLIESCVQAGIQAYVTKDGAIGSEKAEYLSETELMEKLGIKSRSTLHRNRKKKNIPFHRIGGQIRYIESEVLEAIKKS